MRKALVKMLAIAAAAALAGCASHRPPEREGGPGGHREEEWHSPVQILLRYADKDGKVTRAEMEAGLRKDFNAADTNHDGVLDLDEMRAVNEKRWNEDQAAASPLVDWNHKGYVDFDDFAATARSLFDQLDTKGDGVLTPAELKIPGSGPEPGKGEKSGNEQSGHRGKGGHGGGGGPGGGGPGGDDGDGGGGGNPGQ
ncbi:MAG: hypothetical protein WCA78_04810 [Rhizomicrobium sp.]